MILVDSSIWILASRQRQSAEAEELRALLDLDEVATTDIVIAEILQGARTQQDFNDLSARLDALHYFPADRHLWEKAAELSFQLRNRGLITPLADLVIAYVAKENDLDLYTADDHFDRVVDLGRHTAANYVSRRQTRGTDLDE